MYSSGETECGGRLAQLLALPSAGHTERVQLLSEFRHQAVTRQTFDVLTFLTPPPSSPPSQPFSVFLSPKTDLF